MAGAASSKSEAVVVERILVDGLKREKMGESMMEPSQRLYIFISKEFNGRRCAAVERKKAKDRGNDVQAMRLLLISPRLPNGG